jgi:hypothetical protein
LIEVNPEGKGILKEGERRDKERQEGSTSFLFGAEKTYWAVAIHH